MTDVQSPGQSELGWLADLKPLAEAIGREVWRQELRWEVEALPQSTRRRPDVIIRLDSTSEILASGEAKRPDDPQGLHPLVATEVRDALEKARILGAPLCFTTNFLQAAVFDARANTGHLPDLDRMQGGLVELIPEIHATAPSWWLTLPNEGRAEIVVPGLRRLFERLLMATRGTPGRETNEVVLYVFATVTGRLVEALSLTLAGASNGGSLPAELTAHALRVQLNPNDRTEGRYLVAQGVAEVLTASLFYRTIQSFFALDHILAGTRPQTPEALQSRVASSFASAIQVSGDYQTVFGLSPAARWALREGGEPVRAHWIELFLFLELLDFTTVTSEVIGTIFERLISPERRHAMGQHYTNPRVARVISTWAIRSPDDHIGDIACGAGTFLVEAYARLRQLGRTHQQTLEQVLGNDLDPFAVHLATVNLATRDIYRGPNYPAVSMGNAFDLRSGSVALSVHPLTGENIETRWPAVGLDAVIGNPPFDGEPADVDSIRRQIVEAGGIVPSGMRGGNLAAWFALLADTLVRRNGGRWGLVMPSSVLQNSNLAAWRTWLRTRHDVVIWHGDDDVWFSDARVATCVVMAAPPSEPPRTTFVNVVGRVAGETIDRGPIPLSSPNDAVRDLTQLPLEADVLVAGTCPDILSEFSAARGISRLAKLPGVRVESGNKLGHPMYQLRDDRPSSPGVVRQLSGHKLAVKLNREYLLPLLRSPMDERTGEFTGSEYFVLNAPVKLPTTGSMRSYVESCKELGAHVQPSVRSRGSAWWHVDWKTSQVAIQIHPSFLHQIWWSTEPFVAKNNFHTLGFDGEVPSVHREMLAASLASAFGALSALFISSEVGCEGVRWVSTRQLEQWPVVDPFTVSASDREVVISAYRAFRTLRAEEMHQMSPATRSAWLRLTDAVAAASGASNPHELALKAIQIASDTCLRRARREGLALSGRARGGTTARGNFGAQVRERAASFEGAATIIEGLTSGNFIVRTRPIADQLQGSLGLEGSNVAYQHERELTELLGVGFECAPPAESAAEFVVALRRFLTALTESFIGPAPADVEALETYLGIDKEIRRHSVAWLQTEVRRRLR